MAHRTRYRDTASNIKVLLRQQTSMTLNDRFHKIMKMPAPPPPRAQTPPRQADRTDDRMRNELRQHQRKLEQLERSALQMMSRSLTVPTIAPVAPSLPIYEPPKPSAKARLGMNQRLGAKKLSQKYAKSRLGPKRLSNASAPAPRARAAATTRGRSSTRGGRGGGVNRATTAAAKAAASSPRTAPPARGKGRVKAVRGGRGGAAKGKVPEPKKEDLDSELDKYMSNSKVYLDNQLVDYMAQKEKDAAKS